MLAGLGGNVHLQINPGELPGLSGDPVDVAREIEAIHAMNRLNDRQDFAHFVGLQMPDQVPAQRRWKLGLLGQQLLHAVLAEETVPVVHRLTDDFYRDRLCHCNQFNVSGIPPGARGGLGDFGVDKTEVVVEKHVGVSDRLRQSPPLSHMQIETFKIFCDLVETGSFSQAAGRNDITQSAVSQQIRVLEEKFKAVFFERGGKKFAVTPEGQIFERAAREILALYENIGSRLHDMRDEVSGPLRVTTVYSIGLHQLPAKLERFRALHPEVDVVVEYRRSPAIYDDILEGRADLGLVPYPQRGKGIISDVFDEDELVLICAPTHSLAKRKKVKLRELDGENFVAFEPDTPTRKAIDRAVRQHNVSFAQQHEFDTIETVKRAVEVAGVVSIVPHRTVEKEQAAGRLCVVTLDDVNLLRPLGILRRQARVTTPAMREFMRVMMDGTPSV